MRVLSKPALKRFWGRHSKAKAPLEEWWKTLSTADWASHAELKATYISADIYNDCYIFNIGGDNYRLIGKVEFKWLMVYARGIMRRPEFAGGRWEGGLQRK